MSISDIRHLDLNLLVVLDALYKERSVTRAAERLALTQPTVSGMLKRLRDTFGDDLYVRTSHGVMPTPRAEVLAPQVAQILEAAGALLVPERFDPDTTAFKLTFCGSDYVLQTVLGALAGKVMAAAPNARISVTSRPSGLISTPDGEIETQLARGEIDLLVSVGETAPRDFPSLYLYEDEMVFTSSYAAHAHGQLVSSEELIRLRHVILGAASLAPRRVVDQQLSALGLSRQIALEVPNYATLFQAMRHGEFVAFLPRKIAKQHAENLRFLSTALEIPAVDVVASWHPRMTGDPCHIWLRDRLLALIGDLH